MTHVARLNSNNIMVNAVSHGQVNKQSEYEWHTECVGLSFVRQISEWMVPIDYNAV